MVSGLGVGWSLAEVALDGHLMQLHGTAFRGCVFGGWDSARLPCSQGGLRTALRSSRPSQATDFMPVLASNDLIEAPVKDKGVVPEADFWPGLPIGSCISNYPLTA